MEILIIQKEAFEEMAAKFSRFAERVDALLAKRQVIKPLDGQPGSLPAVEHQSAHVADATRQRHAGLFAD